MTDSFDLIIIGGGPAGCAAAVYASRKLLKTALVTEDWGGQSNVSTEIQNWIGTIALTGADLAKNLKSHVEAYAKDIVSIVDGDRVEKIEKKAKEFAVTTKSGKTFEAKTVLICSGASRKKLMVPGAEEFDQKGLTYCASCDGPLFSGMDVAVVGGGNAAFDTASQLLAYTKSVTLVHHGAEFKADPATIKKVLSHPNIKVLTLSEPKKVIGDKFVTGLEYTDKKTGKPETLAVSGIFVEIGIIPNTSFARDLLELDQYGRIVVDSKNQKTTMEGIWAAGDCTNELYHQNNIAAGDAVKALEDIYYFLHAR